MLPRAGRRLRLQWTAGLSLPASGRQARWPQECRRSQPHLTLRLHGGPHAGLLCLTCPLTAQLAGDSWAGAPVPEVAPSPPVLALWTQTSNRNSASASLQTTPGLGRERPWLSPLTWAWLPGDWTGAAGLAEGAVACPPL